MPCEYDAQRGGFPLAVLVQPQPAEFCCVACQRIARDAVTACKGPRVPSPRRAHERPISKAAIFLALLRLSCCCCRGPLVLRPLRDGRAAQATAVPALQRSMPRRAHSQSGRTPCHCGDGCAVPCAVRVGGAAGGAGCTLGAVPAGARPVPHRCGALPRQDRARAGRRSVGDPQCSAATRRQRPHAPLRAHRTRLNEWRRFSLRPFPRPTLSPRPRVAVRVRADAVQPVRRGRRAGRHGGRWAGRGEGVRAASRGGVPRPPRAPSVGAWLLVGALWGAVGAVAFGVPAGLRGVGGAVRAGRARARVPARGGGRVRGGGVRGGRRSVRAGGAHGRQRGGRRAARGRPGCGLPLVQRRAGAGRRKHGWMAALG